VRRPAHGLRALLLLAAAAVALIVGLTGWLLANGTSGAPPAPRHPAARSGLTTAAAPRTVEVSQDTLTGQPVDAVVPQLRELGLRVAVVKQPSDQDPGTVLSVQPSGQVPVGTTVVVTVSAHHHGDGGGGQGGGGN
jgi:serine/threonine-protein kinase